MAGTENHPVFEAVIDQVKQILKKVFSTSKVEVVAELIEYIDEDELSTCRDILFARAKEVFYSECKKHQIATDTLNLEVIAHKKDRFEEKLASDIVELLLYIVGDTDVFPKSVLNSKSLATYIDTQTNINKTSRTSDSNDNILRLRCDNQDRAIARIWEYVANMEKVHREQNEVNRINITNMKRTIADLETEGTNMKRTIAALETELRQHTENKGTKPGGGPTAAEKDETEGPQPGQGTDESEQADMRKESEEGQNTDEETNTQPMPNGQEEYKREQEATAGHPEGDRLRNAATSPTPPKKPVFVGNRQQKQVNDMSAPDHTPMSPPKDMKNAWGTTPKPLVDGDGWETPSYHRRRQNGMKSYDNDKNVPLLNGIRKEDCEDVYVSNIERYDNESLRSVADRVKKWCKNNDIHVMNAHIVRNRRCEYIVGCRLTVPIRCTDKMLGNRIWPTDAICKRWVPQKEYKRPERRGRERRDSYGENYRGREEYYYSDDRYDYDDSRRYGDRS